MSLISEAAAAMDLIFDTFKRDFPITFYKDSQQVVTVHDPVWNADFGNPWADNITHAAQSATFDARIIWTKEDKVIKAVDGDENLNLKVAYPVGSVRIQVKEEAFEWLKEAKSFIIKDERFVRNSDWRGIGMLGAVNRYEVVLEKNQ